MSINWNALREPKKESFEELCCQLALKEPQDLKSRFVRRGTPDSGLECFWLRPDGTKVGWQAKFFLTSLTDTQWSQLDSSVKTALAKNPDLSQYIICLPQNLPDAAQPNSESARQKWDKRVEKWKQWATQGGKSVDFELWDESALVARISQEQHRGTHWFWFGTQSLTTAWFRDHVGVSIKNAGPRYTSELHIDTHQQLQFDAMGRTSVFHSQIIELFTSLRLAERSMASRSVNEDLKAELDIVKNILSKALVEIELWATAEISTATWWHTDEMPWRSIESQLDLLADGVHACWRKIESCREAKRGEKDDNNERRYIPPDDFTSISNNLIELIKAVRNWESFLATPESDLCNKPFMVLVGEAGQGKTHRLCEIARRRTESTKPTILLFGEQFQDEEPWGQIINLLGLNCIPDDLIGGLEAAAIASGNRALILIDAINEGKGNQLWKVWLPGLVEKINKSPWIGLCITVRDNYEKYVIPEDAMGDSLIRIEHRGFGEVAYAAAVKFFTHFGIEPSQPLLVPEFENPLFLKLFCSALYNDGLKRMPDGLRGITSIFDYYMASLDRKLSQPKALDYDVRDHVVKNAVYRLADAMAAATESSLPLNFARDIVDALLPRSGFENSLFHHLESEGIISVAPTYVFDDENESFHEHVRFTYQRFGDHLITKSLLKTHLDSKNPSKSFLAGTTLHGLTKDSSTCFQNYGIVEALCIQLPETIGKELHQVAPYLKEYHATTSAMIESIIWRDASKFTDATNDYIRTEIRTRRNVEDYVNALITLAPTVGHPFNADKLHRILTPLSIADRDSEWSIFLSSEWGQQGPIDRLVDWSWNHSDEYTCDDEVIRLAATALIWFLTTSTRELRDSATKALVRLCKKRLLLLPVLFDQFSTVDEPYLFERLMAVAYGCALRSHNNSELATLAQYVYDNYFRTGTPPVHLNTRDYGRGIIEVAIQRDCKISVDVDLVRPPYKSDWPTAVEMPMEFEVNKYSGLAFYNEITSSFEDFSKYLTDFSEWSPRRLGESRKSNREKNVRLFVRSLTDRQKSEWSALLVAQKAMLAAEKPERRWQDSVKKKIADSEKAFLQTERKFLRTLGPRSLKKQTYVTNIAGYLRNPNLYKRMDWFDYLPARRWMVKRVIDLGWTAKRFGRFDDDFRGHRSTRPRLESIGKKYCWIALRELQARCADNFQLRTDYNNNEFKYVGPWDTGWGRDIDPSNLLSKTGNESYRGHENSWWFPTVYDKWQHPTDHLEWLKEIDDLPDPKSLIYLTSPTDNSKWLTLSGYFRWEQPTPPGERRYDVSQRSIWYMLKSYFVRNGDLDAIVSWAADKRWMNDWMPRSNDTHEVYLGEFFWADSYKRYPAESPERTDWTTHSFRASMPVPLLITNDAYGWSSTEADSSLQDGISLELPCKFIVDELDLRIGTTEGQWIDAHNRLIARDPCTESSGPSALLINESAVLELLKRHDLSIFWTLLAEKQMIGGDYDHNIGHLEINGIYSYRNGVIDGKFRPVFFAPGTWTDPSAEL
jgi:hypothetical protein